MRLTRRMGFGLAVVLCFGLAALPAAAQQTLVKAIREGEPTAAVKALVDNGANVNTPEPDGATPLAWAAHRDNLEVADLLIRAGANVNAANDYGVTPLALACVNRSAAMVDRLLKGGADPNAKQMTGETPLIVCSYTGAGDAVKLLLAKGADVKAKETEQGQTALMRAAAGRHADVVQLLVTAGADVHAYSKGGFTPLQFAAQQGDIDSAKILLAAGVGVDEAPAAETDSRRDAWGTGGDCATGRTKCFTPSDNGTPLVIATASGHEAMALFLLERGANPNAVDAYGRAALHYAIPDGWAGIDSFFYRPFHDKTRIPDMPNLVKALLAKGANSNAQITRDYSPYSRGPYAYGTSAVGATPFAFAAAAADLEVMRILLNGGADPKMPTKDGTTPLMFAAGVGRIQDRRDDEEAAALEAVKLAHELGIDVNAANAAGRTALHGAASVGADPIIKFLAETGAKLDAPDRRGVTPYGIAAGMAGDEEHADRIYKDTMSLLVQLAGKPLEGIVKMPAPAGRGAAPAGRGAAPGGGAASGER